jgi:hypothetical protein
MPAHGCGLIMKKVVFCNLDYHMSCLVVKYIAQLCRDGIFRQCNFIAYSGRKKREHILYTCFFHMHIVYIN